MSNANDDSNDTEDEEDEDDDIPSDDIELEDHATTFQPL